MAAIEQQNIQNQLKKISAKLKEIEEKQAFYHEESHESIGKGNSLDFPIEESYSAYDEYNSEYEYSA